MSLPSQTEGAGNTGCTLHPRSREQRAQKTRSRADRFSGGNPAFPAQWFYAYTVLSPAIRPWVVTVACAPSRKLDASHEASGPHVFAVHIRRHSSKARSASTAPRPALVTLRNAPLSGTEFRKYRSDLNRKQANNSENQELF